MASTKKRKPKYSNAVILSVILACTLVVVVSIVVIALALNRPPDPVAAIEAEAMIDMAAVFDDVMTTDLQVSYPETPEAVMELFNNTFRLLYSRDIDDIDVLAHILNIQRGLYAAALLEMNAFEGQLSNLMFAREEQEALSLEIIGIHQAPPVVDRFSSNRVGIQTIKYANNGQRFHYDFQLFRHPESQLWQIGMWTNTMNQ